MPAYRIHRLRDYLRNSFRSAPHVSGVASLKPRDYTPGGEVTASSPYAAYFDLRESEDRLDVGDVLESAEGDLRVYKYVGFEEAKWVLPEVKPEEAVEADAVLSGGAETV